ncbi:type VI secretion system protein VasJ [Pseudorhizobium tarimense]|uniref:Type VI secretion system protein VasJ n=1 Tax=Pseudorhizobium tarimense TaxID=1079109 RepID=A0ABV2H451_9HYPH|nr:type VI secretion system protein TssA [Pseudorhizobium tarimense]MCJ8518562.1 type VI secretion system protein TssA [Pseudorhizobium tarimense]
MPDLDLDVLLGDPRSSIGTAAISVDLPAGIDLRDEPDFDQLETEFRKMETDGPKAVDWRQLNRRTLEVLTGRSKDIVLACRLVYGLHHEEGYKGLAVGSSIVRGMVAEHWENLFPGLKRERARAGSVDWMAERLGQIIEAQPPVTPEARTYALVAHDRLVELDELLSEKMQKFPVALGPLIRALRPVAREVRSEIEAKALAEAAARPPAEAPPSPPDEPEVTIAPVEAAPAAVPAPSTPAPPRPTAVAAPEIGDMPVAEGVDPAFDSLFSAAIKVSGALREAASADPRVYLASRFGAWSGITAAPPDRAGKTTLPPPQRHKLQELAALNAANNQHGLLLAAESAFVTSPYWLTMQFTVFRTMRALGSDYDAAREAIVGALALLLQRVPPLIDLSFSDGTPFADADTRAWISDEVAIGAGGNAAGGAMDKASGDAARLAQQGKIVDGLKLLSDFADTAPSGRERFLAKLEIGEFCLRHDLVQPAFALVQSLGKLAEDQCLARWEPALAARLLVLAWQCHAHKNAVRILGESAVQQGKAKLAEQLSALDIVQAVRLTSS